MGELDPIVGQWYLDLEQDDRFKVLSMDERGDEVEIEYEDGEIRTLNFDEWYDLDLDLLHAASETAESDEMDESPNDFIRPTRSRRYREEDDEDEDEEDDDEDLDEDWDDR